MATLRNLVAALLITSVVSSSHAEELEDDATGNETIVDFEKAFPNQLILATFKEVKTCNLDNEFKQRCTDEYDDSFNSNNVTACIDLGCCYFDFSDVDDSVRCYKPLPVLGRSRTTQGGYYVIGNKPVQGQGFGYPPNTVPGRVPSGNRYYVTSRPTIQVQKPAVTVRRILWRDYTFSFFKIGRTYDEALQECVKESSPSIPSTLLEISNKLVSDFITSKIRSWENEIAHSSGCSECMGYWVGGNDRKTEGRWQWESLNDISLPGQGGYQNWYKSGSYQEPNGANGKDCLTIAATDRISSYRGTIGKWFDGDCNTRRYYICMKGASVKSSVFNTGTVICPPGTCLNGGQCFPFSPNGGYQCRCNNGFSGDRCEIPPSRPTIPPTQVVPTTSCCAVQSYFRKPCGYTGIPGNLCRNRFGCCYNDLTRSCFHRSLGCRGPARTTTTVKPTTTPTVTPARFAYWLKWSGWSKCSRSCGQGRWTRIRGCMGGIPGKAGCLGESTQIGGCNIRPCPVPTWTAWGQWSACSVSCGSGSSFRIRQCQVEGKPTSSCPGAARDVRTCGQPCVAWSRWGSWGKCSVTCGNGFHSRSRTCIQGTPGVGNCQGKAQETEPCIANIRTCVVPAWAEWGTWTSCSVTCGKGRYSRTRLCKNGVVGGNGCSPASDAVQLEECTAPVATCSRYGEWSEYSRCSLTCGGGRQTRTRICIGGNDCVGESSQTITCNNQECASWSSWESWSQCSKDCGTGVAKRVRRCIGGDVGAPGCIGRSAEEKSCNTQSCPTWSSWSDYSECTDDCGGGTTTRNRTCLNGDIGQTGCEGASADTRDCNTSPCDTWGQWNSWSGCSADCGSGISIRSRTCLFGIAGVGRCQGASEQRQVCNQDPCASWGPWRTSGECSVTCGEGVRTMRRECIDGIAGISEGCLGESSMDEDCDAGVCESWSEWARWSVCSRTCGQGTQSRTRECQFGVRGMPGCIGDISEVKDCDPETLSPCPAWGEWEDFTECSESCGTGTQMRSRTCSFGVQGESGCVGSATFSQNCNTQPCPSWTTWGEWRQCTASCNGGTQNRIRTCSYGVPGQDGCLGRVSETRDCNERRCVSWGEWSEFGQCSKTCGTGTYLRTRECNGASAGDPGCEGLATNENICNDFDCPGWAQWLEFSDCTVTCGSGIRTRIRLCVNGLIGQEGCPIEQDEETIECNPQNCPRFDQWTGWSSCTVSCGGGEQTRIRSCLYGVQGDAGCQGMMNETRICNGQTCPIWTEWNSWTSCQFTCGSEGTRRRTRSCSFGEAGDFGCDGPAIQDEPCNRVPCPRLTEWSQWSICSASCNGGLRSRNRQCLYGTNEDVGCIGPVSQEEDCDVEQCRSWTPWSLVERCSVSCGIGTQSRFRLCIGGSPGEPGCEGLQQDVISCNEGVCPSWSPWGDWSICSVTCGGGFQERVRTCVNGEIGVDGCIGEESDVRECNAFECVGNRTSECERLDLVFIIDSSSSIRETNFNTVRRFLQGIIRQLRLGGDNTRLAALRYNRDVELLFNLADNLNTDQALRAIGNMVYDGSGTFTGQALTYAATNIFGDSTQNREDVPNLAIVLTDGKAQDRPEEKVQALRALGVKIVVIGVTNQVVESQLNAIATDPDSENVLLVGDFSALLDIVSDITAVACRTAKWTEWTEFSQCDVTCGRGTQMRRRTCSDGFQILDECEGASVDMKACNAGPCPVWSEWIYEGPCPVTCGGGRVTRTRVCLFGTSEQSGCEGESEEDEPCGTEDCPVWELWTEWTLCDRQCGGGSQIRTRECQFGSAGFNGCYGSTRLNRFCNAEPCATWVRWSQWSFCSDSCGGGIRSRSRICLYGSAGDDGCQGDENEVQECATNVSKVMHGHDAQLVSLALYTITHALGDT